MHVLLRPHRVRGSVVALLALSFGLGACTLLLDRSSEQCESDDECDSKLEGTVCSSDHVCVAALSDGVPCATTQDCVDLQGDYHICRKRDHTCVALKSPECPVVEGGDYKDDNAVFFGSVLALTESDMPAVAGPDTSTANAISLAVRNFVSLGSLPPATPGGRLRPLVFIGCDDAGLNAKTSAAGVHLADIGVPAIIGAASSGRTIELFNSVNVDHKVLIVSPKATSSSLTDLSADTDGLLWRTAPSDVYQSQAITQYFTRVEQSVREQIPAGQRVKVVILHKGDPYGEFLGGSVEKQLMLNNQGATDPVNQSNYKRVSYGDPGLMDVSEKYAAAVDTVLDQAPDVIIIIGLSEVVEKLITPIEARWAEAGESARPRYILSDGVSNHVLYNAVSTQNDLRTRIRGTAPGAGANNENFKLFRANYEASYTEDKTGATSFGAAGAYDAAYLLVYSAVAAGASPLDGLSLAAGMKKMVRPMTGETVKLIDVGQEQIGEAFDELSSGRAIDFNGASGPLDFDTVHGEAPSDIQIWCLPLLDGQVQGAQSSGLYYDAALGQLQGAETSANCQ